MTHSLNPVARSKEPRRFGVAALIVALLVHPQTAFAAEGTQSGPSEVIFLAEIIVLVLAGRLLGEAMQRIGQPGVVGQLIAGILLGPSVLGLSVLGLIWPEAQHALFPKTPEQKAMIDAVAQLGILMLLLLTGMETDLALARKVGRAAISISIAGIAAPFLCGFALGQFLPDALLPAPEQRLITSLFLGTALAISSVKIVALIVREMHFMRRNVGQIIVASAIIDDTIGWIIVAIIFGLAQHGTVDAAGVARSVIGTAAFLAVSLTIGRRIVSGLIRWTNDNFVSEVPVISMILVIMGMMALITHLIGVHTVLGAFIAGVLIGESPILTRHIDEQLRGLITALFAPVFFGIAGLGTDLTVLTDSSLLLLMLAVIAIASIGKFGGAFLGGRLGGLTWRESLALGCGMNARGSTEVIIATVGLSLGMLNQTLFTVIVAMAVVTTMVMPPTLRWALARLPMRKEEQERLDREEFESSGFVTNLERLLIAVDDSANGKFAARLAGLIAGLRGMPTTLLRIAAQSEEASKGARRDASDDEKAVRAGAKAARAATDKADKPRTVDITTRVPDADPEQAIAREARRGHDFLVIGLERAIAGHGFDAEVSRLAMGFEGPFAIVVARGVHLERPMRSPLNILVPTTGTEASRRAAEVAIALARASRAPIAALYVTRGRPRKTGTRALRDLTRTRRHEEAILKDVADMADRYDVSLRTALRVDSAPEDAILREARLHRHNLIVIGVSRRPGERLFLGDLAEAMLERSDRSLLFVASGGVSTAAEGRGQEHVRDEKARRDKETETA